MKDGKERDQKAILNTELARRLRQHGLEAEAEQSINHGGRLNRFDVLVELGDQVVEIDAEFAPARTFRSDAEQLLLEGPIRWRGLPITAVSNLVYPESLKNLPESRARDEFARCKALKIQEPIRRVADAAARPARRAN